MDWDEPKSKSAGTMAVGDNLDSLSVDELEARVKAFEQEIARVKAEIATKKARQTAAASFFKS